MEEFNHRKKLKNYIKKNLSKGYTLDSLKWALLNQGYSPAIIRISIEEVNKELAKKAPILKEKPRIIHKIIDENHRPIILKKPLWKRIFGR